MFNKLACTALAVAAASLPMISLSSQSALAEDRRDFAIHNNNALAITEFYVSPAYSDHWGYDYLKSPLENGESGVFTFNDNSNQCIYDVKAVYSNGTYDLGRHNLCSSYIIYYIGNGGEYAPTRR